MGICHPERPLLLQWWGGLRGAVAFALIKGLDDDYPMKDLFLTTTLFIIILTVFPMVSACNSQSNTSAILVG